MKPTSIEEEIIFERLTSDRKLASIEDKVNHLYRLRMDIDAYIYRFSQAKDCTAIKPISTNRTFMKTPIIFFKRFIRKFTLWLIEPAWQQQSYFNNSIASAVKSMAEITNNLMKEVYILKKENSAAKHEDD